MIPNCIGYKLEDARRLFEEAGIHIDSIQVTLPPRDKEREPAEHYRIVRQKLISEKNVQLIVCKPL